MLTFRKSVGILTNGRNYYKGLLAFLRSLDFLTYKGDKMNGDHINRNAVLTRYEYHKNLLKNEISVIKSIKIPTQNYSINNNDLVEWIIEETSPNELEELLRELKIVKKRTKNIKPFLAIIAVGLLNKAQ